MTGRRRKTWPAAARVLAGRAALARRIFALMVIAVAAYVAIRARG